MRNFNRAQDVLGPKLVNKMFSGLIYTKSKINKIQNF